VKTDYSTIAITSVVVLTVIVVSFLILGIG
jgi:hypothetical protein